MNLARVIEELRGNGLTSHVLDDHHVARRERDRPTGADISRIDPLSEHHYSDDDVEDAPAGDLAGPGDTHRKTQTIPGEFLTGIDPEAELEDLPRVEDFDREIERDGTDALAWYRSPHWEPTGAWGIYVREPAVYSLAREVFASLSFSPHRHKALGGRPVTTIERVRQGFRLLFLHEWVHFVTDLTAMAVELSSPSPKAIYVPYLEEIYMRPLSDDEPLEEALANSFAYDRLPGTKFRPALKAFFRRQPPGYRAFESFRGSDFDFGRRRLAALLVLRRQMGARPPLELLLDPDSRDISFSDVPVHIVRDHDDPAFRLGFVESIPIREQIETSQFQRDLRKLPKDVVKTYRNKTRRMMGDSLRAGGLNFEALKACDSVFSVRVNRAYRMTLRPRGGTWELLRIGKHDDVYRSPGPC